MSDYSALKALAEAINSCNLAWHANADDVRDSNGNHVCSTFEDSEAVAHCANFIAAANPAMVKALIAEIELLRLEFSGVDRAKQLLAEKLGCAEEPRWKWLLSGVDDLIKDAAGFKSAFDTERALRLEAERQVGELQEELDLISLSFDSNFDAAQAARGKLDTAMELLRRIHSGEPLAGLPDAVDAFLNTTSTEGKDHE